jgi:hypothetical protein
MDVINRGFAALFALILLTVVENASAQHQQPPFYFDKPITLDSLTKYVHGRSKLRFSFNSTKVKGAQLIDLKKGAYTIDQLLQQIRKNTSLYYSVRNGYVIFQDNPPKQKSNTPTVAKINPIKPPVKKKVITANTKPAQIPVKELQAAPVIKTLPVDTVKSIVDSTHIPDSIKVLLPITPPSPLSNNEEDTETARTRRFGRLNLSLGRKPIDTTVIDTLHKNDTPAIAKPAAAPVATKVKERRTRSSSATTRVYDDVATAWSWQYGLQWKGTLPLYGAQQYFTGTNTRSEPYNLLIPGVWLSTTVNNRHEFMLLVKPADWYYYNKQIYRKDTGTVTDYSDTIPKIIPSRNTTTLIKTGGWYGSLQYNYHINENWLVGAGIGYHLRVRGLAWQQAYINLSDSLFKDSLISMQKGTETDNYLASSFITGKLEVAYQFGAFDAGASLLIPLTGPFADKSLNKSRPINVQLFLRWRIKRNEDE